MTSLFERVTERDETDLPFRCISRGARVEVEPMGLEPVPILNISATGRGFVHGSGPILYFDKSSRLWAFCCDHEKVIDRINFQVNWQ